eukprot:MONOS_882.1-p1 / transcript=MONOS_882.1 / gene=MONOS_882 / organism=Monocercomonoides_exilis_PA203 / gene_product=putative adenylosuccinate lyase / transcript_product=putative adenylosuccinate lyase / location=Mono_scaffold00014:208119-211112(-) / protein_length=835 / sequence_SO=supercontig / SO=protein_coding / is_pseudo=false
MNGVGVFSLEPKKAEHPVAVYHSDQSKEEIKFELCVECEDHPSMIFCETCGDAFCQECFQAFHKRGGRKNHRTHDIKQKLPSILQRHHEGSEDENDDAIGTIMPAHPVEQVTPSPFADASASLSTPALSVVSPSTTYTQLGVSQMKSWRERAEWIPLRLTPTEQRDLLLVECALNVSEYTEKIDIQSYQSTPFKRMMKQLTELCSLVAGLAVAKDYRQGELLVKDKAFKHYPTFFQHMFEVARRYKITNPEKMRTSYGKLMYALMDSQWSDILAEMGMACVVPIRTVVLFIAERDGATKLTAREREYEWSKQKELEAAMEAKDEAKYDSRMGRGEFEKNAPSIRGGRKPIHLLDELLDDPLLNVATREIFSEGKEREIVQREIREKEKAIKILCSRYSRTAEDIKMWEEERETRKAGCSSEQLEYEERELNEMRKREAMRQKNGDEMELDEDPSPLDSQMSSSSSLSSSSSSSSSASSASSSLRPVSEDDVRLIIYSFADNQSFLRYNSLPCQKMLDYLHRYFHPSPSGRSEAEKEALHISDDSDRGKREGRGRGEDEESSDDEDEEGSKYNLRGRESFVKQSNYSPWMASWMADRPPSPEERLVAAPANTWQAKSNLSISSGIGGARLTHSHHVQYKYVEQTLILWREIVQDFFKLWSLAEQDLVAKGNYYRLRDTGQGMNRMQSCPRVGRAMNQILTQVMSIIKGSWVGSSAVHLGDTNVPNAFMFIDKYTQVSRILTPIVSVLDKLPFICHNPFIHHYIKREYGSIDLCRMEILQDFFRFGFDGSGADNYFEAGSCIDGRLTSAWNWCSKIEKKRYFPVFLLCGFIGFDGQF